MKKVIFTLLVVLSTTAGAQDLERLREDSVQMACDIEWLADMNRFYDSILCDMTRAQEYRCMLPFSVLFDSGSYVPVYGQDPVLEALTGLIMDDTAGTYTVYAYGYRDEPDTTIFRRAISVANFLVGSGVDPCRLVLISKHEAVLQKPLCRVSIMRNMY